MNIGKYTLVNDEKVQRALVGTPTRLGQLSGGLQSRPDWSTLKQEEKDKILLAEYDKLGGLITKGGLKVSSGTFWDFKQKGLKDKPSETFEMNIEGDIIAISEDEAKAIDSAKKKVAEIKAKKIADSGEKPKKKIKFRVQEDNE